MDVRSCLKFFTATSQYKTHSPHYQVNGNKLSAIVNKLSADALHHLYPAPAVEKGVQRD